MTTSAPEAEDVVAQPASATLRGCSCSPLIPEPVSVVISEFVMLARVISVVVISVVVIWDGLALLPG